MNLSNACPSLVLRDLWSADHFQLALTHASVKINVLDLDVERTVRGNFEPRPCFPHNIQEEQKGPCKIVLEENGGIQVGSPNWPESNVELSHQAKQVHYGTDIRAPNSKESLEWELIDAVALLFPVNTTIRKQRVPWKVNQVNLPGHSEADMGYRNTAEDEERGETGEGEQPGKDVSATILVQVDEGQASEEKLQDRDGDGSAFFVDVGKQLGTHSCAQLLALSSYLAGLSRTHTMLSQCLECSGGAECAGIGHTHN